jgi:hypothetical protein
MQLLSFISIVCVFCYFVLLCYLSVDYADVYQTLKARVNIAVKA